MTRKREVTQRTFEVTGPGGGTYHVTLDETGVVDVDGLLPSTADQLKAAVERGMTVHRLPLSKALGHAVGSYSTVVELPPPLPEKTDP